VIVWHRVVVVSVSVSLCISLSVCVCVVLRAVCGRVAYLAQTADFQMEHGLELLHHVLPVNEPPER
jgi:hypothetical protein